MMSSIFDNSFTRLFCVSGMLTDVFCTAGLNVMSFEELLNRRLHELGYKHVVFYSGAKGKFFALDNAGAEGLNYMHPRGESKPSQYAENKLAPLSAKSQPLTKLVSKKTTDAPAVNPAANSASNPAPSGNLKWNVKVDETSAANLANNYMTDESARKALVFTSLEDFVNNGDKGRRRFNAYFEDWKSLSGDNKNICVFLSKVSNAGMLQQIFSDKNSASLRPLFIKSANSGAAEFNRNSSMMTGAPLNDELGNLLEYLRIVGHKYSYRDENDFDVEANGRLVFHRADRADIIRRLGFCNHKSELGELKSVKEKLERFIENARCGEVVITPDDVDEIYGFTSGSCCETEDPLEFIKNRAGWESAAVVIDRFVQTVPKPEKDHPLKGASLERIDGRNTKRVNIPVPNFVLQGPPGVGKSEIASLIGQILQRRGIIKSGHTVIGTHDKLVGGYVGHTAIQTASMIEQAQEGVLLIDEVYSLVEQSKDGGNDFGQEAINTLVAAMTNPNYHFCVIFAGYASRMQEVWDSNEGLFSRFGDDNVINLEEYKPELLRKIFEKRFTGGSDGVAFSEDVKRDLPEFFRNYFDDRDRANFGNARDVHKLADAVIRAARYRCKAQGCTAEKVDFAKFEPKFEKRGMSTEDIYGELENYVGLDFLREMLNDQWAIKIESELKGLEYPGPAHMVWHGNPGTGKSTAAQLVAPFYHSLGIFGGSEPIYPDASDIISQYVGASSGKINEKIDEACQHNTVLIIEEAYQLIENVHGRDAVNAILNRMETDRRRFNLVFVLYTENYKDFLSLNPGLQSRVNIYEFKDYTAEQLYMIFEKMCAKNKDIISPECADAVKDILAGMYEKKITSNGNARIVRQLIENMRQRRFKRILKSANASNIGELAKNGSPELGILTIEDLPPIDEYIAAQDDLRVSIEKEKSRRRGAF